ncbi:capsule polysaccharide export protein KpsE/RkpR [Bacillus mesophilus]|uniref:Uncharacterized protein n=1 Tax=Bacillus mesophilus TaxID=1808955 RepID=A0A6M0Q9E8_9BACI|nr:hypothetical protein [Bacillus mesophilus]MBM7662399.1 capsule polysaccharide export protein KpsE/RkpR [Bacillus mesophilus]NEY72974.1 hypothetical protein [Bacillus mesophilus]
MYSTFSNRTPNNTVILTGGIGELDTKMNHDRYDVYVNGEFVGHKVLLTQSEDITDVNDFLKTQGFKHFEGRLDGDHYDLHVEDNQSLQDMREALQIYLQIR